jgi:hypothetical protein
VVISTKPKLKERLAKVMATAHVWFVARYFLLLILSFRL